MVQIDVVFAQSQKCLDVAINASTQAMDIVFAHYQDSGGNPGKTDYYDGDYDVTPLITAQTLPTRSKTMRDDVRIDMIPTREIPNAAGGVTFVVGG